MEMINVEIFDEEGGTSDQRQKGSQVPTEYVVNEVETSSDNEGETIDRPPSNESDQVPTPVIQMAEVETSNGEGDQQPQSGSQAPPEVLQIVIVQTPLPWRPIRRKFHKVPPLLLTEEKKRQDYIPKVVSIGPYHHGKSELSFAEAFKPTALNLFVSGGGRTRRFYYNRVLEEIGEIRSCYEEGSTDAYSDCKLAKMMLLDACFIIIHIESGTPPEGEPEMHGHEHRSKVMTTVEHLGLLTSAIVLRDLFLLENQIPLSILNLLIDLRYGNGAGEKLLNRFMNGTLFGLYEPIRRLPLEHGGEPLHLLEAFRRIVVCDWIEPEQEPGSTPPINAEPRVNPSASSDIEAGMDPTTNADPATAGVGCRCLCWKQCCPCFKYRWLCCFRVDQEPHASPSINSETSVNRSAVDLAANGDPEMTGLNAAMCSVCRFLCCCRIQEIDGNPANSTNVDTDVNLTTVADQAMTNIGC
ncbi:UNVERIFIED_CONTAM: hypothetical protein Scaly_0838900 [Sesamum calycinum]|uniref:Uncharacterized protein n=1 Tax=Sesamum calycinum TaxID=2727403 RepID=A0AAW2RBS5_9LAMI